MGEVGGDDGGEGGGSWYVLWIVVVVGGVVYGALVPLDFYSMSQKLFVKGFAFFCERDWPPEVAKMDIFEVFTWRDQ